MMTELQYLSLLSFEISLPNSQNVKEGINQELLALFIRHEEFGMTHDRLKRQSDSKGNIILEYAGTPFANLLFNNRFVIGDNTIFFSYEEKSNQSVVLPNISFYVNMLLAALKVSEKVVGDLSKHSIKCSVKIDNNTECYFYEKYSPLAVDYFRMLKYEMNRVVAFELEIDNEDDIYLLINRFYQQFKTSQSKNKPYVTADKNSFIQTYGRF